MIRWAGRALRFLAALTLMLAVAAAAGIGALAWRLSQGPIPISQLARAMEDYLNRTASGFRLSIGSAAIAWEGFGGGVDRPLDVRVADVRLFDSAGSEALFLPEGEVSLGLRALLLGRFEPRAVRVTGLRMLLVRAEDGAVSLDLGRGDAAANTEETGLPPDNDLGLLAALGLGPAPAGTVPRLAALRLLVVTAADITVQDRQLGAVWRIPAADLALHRRPVADGSAIVVEASGEAVAAAARLPVRLAAELLPDGRIEAELALEAASPAAIAATLPALAPLSAVAAPLSATLNASRSADGSVAAIRLRAALGPGQVTLPGAAPLPVTSARLDLRYAASAVTLDSFTLVLPGAEGPSPTITASGAGVPDKDGSWIAEARVRLDSVAMADLPRLWPEGLAQNERRWIIANVTAGVAKDLDVTLRASVPASLDDVVPDRISGRVRGEDLTVHYLRPMPAAEGVAAELVFASLAEIDIATRGGRVGRIAIPEGRVRLYDLDRRPNMASVTLRIEAPVADALALISHPKLDLVGRRGSLPPGITGMGEIALSVGFPLLDSLGVDELDVTVSARASEVRVPGILAGRDFDRARVELSANRDGLKLSGAGVFGPVTAEVAGEIDFRAGPPTQLVERFSAKVPPQEGLPALFGLDLAPWLTGPVGAEAMIETRRNGQATATVRADLAQARLAVAELGVEKAPRRPGSVEARLSLASGRLTAAEVTRLDAGEISGRARFWLGRNGRLERIEVAEAQIGPSRLSGSVRLPERPGGNYAVTLRAPVIDLSRRSRQAEAAAAGQDQAQPGVLVDAVIDRLVFRDGHELREVQGSGLYARGVIARGEASARAGERGTIRARISPEGPAQRALLLTADDAGAALDALDILSSMAGGTLTIRGTFEDGLPGSPLVGEAELRDFRIREAPAAARVLQAMTLYGVLDLARGPGVSFTRAVASFTWDDQRLELRDARAISPSLGFTAKGTIDRARESIDLEGTIVPAYVFNSLLGRIPLIGRIFSPEAGGGVFAASYRVRGPLSDPEASVNPLSALTPGFLRGLFGIFEGGQSGPSATPPADTQDRTRGG